MGDISRNFNRSEFACKCGCGFDTVDVQLLSYLEEVREEFGPVRVTSGARCPEYNRSVGGSDKSQHLFGRAADIQIDGVSPLDIQDFCEAVVTPNGLGRYHSFTHIDSRSSGLARWEG